MPKSHNAPKIPNFNFIKLWIMLLLTALIFNFYISLKQHSSNFLRNIDSHISYLKLDLGAVKNTYIKQLVFCKNALNFKKLNKNFLKSFFESPNLTLLDKQAIRLIILTDKNFNILFAQGIDEKEYRNTKIDNRDYQSQILIDPNKIVIGKVVNGVLSNEPSIPIATGLFSDNGNFEGAIIFSINLNILSLNLTKSDLIKISFEDINNHYEEIDNRGELAKQPIKFFLTKVLFNPYNQIKFSIENVIDNNSILLTYNINRIKRDFWQSYLYYAAIIFTAILLIGFVFYYLIYKPLLPLMNINSDKNSIFDLNLNSFNNLGKLSVHYSSLQSAKLLINRKEYIINAILKYHSLLVDFNLNKADFLIEDIEDLISYSEVDNEHKTNLLLDNVYNISLNNENDINYASKFIEMIMLETIKNVPKKLNIIDMLQKAGVSREIIKIYNSESRNNLLDNILDESPVIEGFFVEELLTKFFEITLSFINTSASLSKVSCRLDQKAICINFIGKQTINAEKSQELILFKCNALALANLARFNILYQNQEIIVEMYFPTIDCS